MVVGICKRLSIPIAILLCMVVNLQAQRGRMEPLKAGDEVQVEYFGDLVGGKVIGYDGFFEEYKVQITYRGRTRTRGFERDEIRRVKPRTPAPKSRTWKTKTGKHSVNAILVGRDETHVELEKSDKKKSKVPISKLCEADQKYLANYPIEFFQEPQETPPKENGFGRFGSRDRFGSRLDTEGPPSFGNSRPIDQSKARPIVLSSTKSWKVEADPAPSLKLQSFKQFSLGRADFHHDIRVEFAQTVPAAVVSMHHPFEKESTLRMLHMTSGRTIATKQLNHAKFIVVAVSPDGRRVLAVNDKSHKSPFYVFTYTKDGFGEPKVWDVKSFGFPKQVKATFLNNRDVLVQGKSNMVWNVDKGKASLLLSKERKTAVSSGGRYLAIAQKDSVGFYDMQRKKMAGVLACQSAESKRYGFDPQGKRFAAFNGYQLQVWDLTSGKLSNEVWLLDRTEKKTVHWLNDRHILVGEQFLVDLKLKMPVWEYKGDDRNRIESSNAGNLVYVTKEDDVGTISPLTLPQPGLVEECEALESQIKELVKPQPIAVDVDLPINSEPVIEQYFKESFEKHGYQLDDSASLRLSLWVEEGETQTVEVRDWVEKPWAQSSSEIITFTPTVSHFAYKRDGEILIKREKRNNVPHTLLLNRDETAQQAADRYCTPKGHFYTGFGVPKVIYALPNGDELLGSSELTAAGVQ